MRLAAAPLGVIVWLPLLAFGSDDVAGVEKATPADPAAVTFVLGGVVARNVPYRPLNAAERWRLFVRENFGLKAGAYLRAIGSALPDHLDNRPESWGQGSRGYFRRAGDRFGRFTLASAFEHAGA
ncbi:MAG: hypothetical protein ACP5U2_07890, partial [Bryobacteraceae bacterium]